MATEKRLIDANALLAEIERIYTEHYEKSAYKFIHDFFRAMRRRIRIAPTVDAVEVVRCKDCISGKGSTHKACPLYKQGLMKDDDYCSVGERRTDAN